MTNPKIKKSKNQVSHKPKKNKKRLCSNCNKPGHIYRQCTEPVISLGIICVKLEQSYLQQNMYNNLLLPNQHPKSHIHLDQQLLKDHIKFLLIQRRYSIEYVEFLRGRYDDTDIDYLRDLFSRMTEKERNNLATMTFEQLWCDFWRTNRTSFFEKEYNSCLAKYTKIKNGYIIHSQLINIDVLIANIVPISIWNTPEWEFPKGRRNFKESDIDCAEREFTEETGFITCDYKILNNVYPFCEEYTGSNGVKYKHIYYIAKSTNHKVPYLNPDNKYQVAEIGDIGWFSYQEAMQMIRPYRQEKRKVLTAVFNKLKRYFSESM